MISWGVTFSAIALVAALLCFGGISGTASGLGSILVLVGAVFAVMLHLADGQPSPE